MLRYILREVQSCLHTSRTVAAVVVLTFAGLLAAVRPAGALAITTGNAVPAGSMMFVAEITVYDSPECTGSLISPNFVLTAEHCTHEVGAPDSYTVRVGNNVRGYLGEARAVKRIIRNPWYMANATQAGGHNDLALLELSSPITDIPTVKLATPDLAARWDGIASAGPFYTPDQGIEIGWGKNTQGYWPSHLLSTMATITGKPLDGIQIPMITTNGGTCEGDSGGPLLISVNGQMLQAGVMKGQNCGNNTNYTIVGEGPNRDWILSAITPEDPLLAAVPVGTCANDTLSLLDYNYSDQERYAVNCLINQVRLKAGLKKLSFCALSGTYCENNIPGASLNFAQMKGFNIAAQYRAQDVKNCTTGAVFYYNPVSYGACNRPPEWWPRSDAHLCLGLTSSQCQVWYAPGWLPNVYEAQAYGVDGAAPREAVDQILRSTARGAILGAGLNFSAVGVSIGASNGLFMPYSKTGNVYDVLTS
jgi:Trypsin